MQGGSEGNRAPAPSAAHSALHYPQPDHNGRRIGEILVDFGFTQVGTVEAAVNRASVAGLLTGEALIEDGVVTGRQLARGLAARHGMPFLDYDEFPADDQVLAKINTAVARKHMAIPCAWLDPGTLVVAISDPEKVSEMEALFAGRRVRVVFALAQENDVYFMIKRAEALQAAVSGEPPQAGQRAS